MRHMLTAGWFWIALAVACIGVGGGWLAAWQVDRTADAHWHQMAEDDARDVMNALDAALQRAQLRLYAFAMGLPDDSGDRVAHFPVGFAAASAALSRSDTSAPFDELAFAQWLPPTGRAAFEARHGIAITGQESDGTEQKVTESGFVILHSDTLNRTNAEMRLPPGLDVNSISNLAATALSGFQSESDPVVGSIWQAGGNETGTAHLVPMALQHGKNGVILGLLNLDRMLATTLSATLPEGLSVTVRPVSGTSNDSVIFSIEPGTGKILEWESQYQRGAVELDMHWGADDKFQGGISHNLGDGIRVGSIVCALLIVAIIGFASATRRREDALGRERALMQTMVERMSEGITIVDQDLNMVACNDHFFCLYDLPKDVLGGPIPVAHITRFRLERGDFGNVPDPEGFIADRITMFRVAGTETTEEILPDGRVIEIRRMRSPDGFLVSLYLEVTDRRKTERERTAAAALIKATFDHMGDGLTAIDRDGNLLNWNTRFLDLFHIPESAVGVGRNLTGILRTALSEIDADALIRALQEMAAAQEMAGAGNDAGAQDGPTAEVVPLNGDQWVQLSSSPMEDQGSVITYTDVSERLRISEALRRSEERYALAAAGANDGLWDWNIAENQLYTSPRWREMLGIGRDPVSDQPNEWFDRVHPKDIEELHQDIDAHLHGRTDHLQARFRILHADGSYLWALARGIAVRDDAGKSVRLTGSLTDITERKRTEEKLIRDALYDTVTGLPNRALFLDRIEQERRRHADPVEDRYAVLLLDLDRFKVVNDSMGHDLGDALLIEVARRLEKALKAGDSLARLSGDEFGILLTGITSEEEAQDAVHWLQSDLSAAFVIGEQEVFTSVCVGIAMPRQDFSDAEEMLRAADIAMYKAKAKGQSSTAVFDPQMQTRAITQMQLENDLRRAVDRDEIEMYYQPIISFTTGRMSGVEALARWRHPDRGTVVPADFIPLAEDTGLINAIGTTALRLACRQLKAWQMELGDKAPETISVNLSGRQLQDPDLVREIELILAREGVSGSQLKLEVTESMIMMNPEITSRILIELKDLGVALSIDDFGTGYSSLSYLHRFPFDTLKIDRSFVVSMDEKVENMEIIRSIVLLAHNLGMDVIAEGVESERHLHRLKALDCEFGQGFYFATPQPADRVSAMVLDGTTWDMPD